MAETSGLDRFVRRFVPSISALTFNPVFKMAVNTADLPLRLLFREFRALPPNHMRLRVGVGNRILTNQFRYLMDSTNLWVEAFANGRFKLDGTVVEIGCGCGRQAHILRDYRYGELRFSGTYVGVDIDREMLGWCRKHFDSRHFRFHLSGDASASYRNTGDEAAPRVIPEPDGAADLVFSCSLFTHLLEEQAQNYLAESFRLLKPGGVASHTFFCLDFPPPTYGKRHTFSHRMGKAHVESLAQPEAAVAYSWEDIIVMAQAAGFSDVEIFPAKEAWQPTVLFHKAKEQPAARARAKTRAKVAVV